MVSIAIMENNLIVGTASLSRVPVLNESIIYKGELYDLIRIIHFESGHSEVDALVTVKSLKLDEIEERSPKVSYMN